jgi:hypothetical protein
LESYLEIKDFNPSRNEMKSMVSKKKTNKISEQREDVNKAACLRISVFSFRIKNSFRVYKKKEGSSNIILLR